jgi:hypothetical protein
MHLEFGDNPTLGFLRPSGRRDPLSGPPFVAVRQSSTRYRHTSWRSIYDARPEGSAVSQFSRHASGSSAERFGFHRKPTPLIIRELQPSLSDMLQQDAIFLNQIFDDSMLALVQPTN